MKRFLRALAGGGGEDPTRRMRSGLGPGAFILDYPVENAAPVVQFDEAHDWNSHLVINGERAYRYTGGCDSHEYVFEFVRDANLSTTEIKSRLAAGTDLLAGDLLAGVSRLFPSGTYAVCDLMVEPTLTRPGAHDDYFSHEAIDLFGTVAPDVGEPDAQTAYWRVGPSDVTSDTWVGSSELFHLIAPTQSLDNLDRARIDAFKRATASDVRSSALGVSLLMVRAPVGGPPFGAPEGWHQSQHAILSTFVLDGHHKIQAAAEMQTAVRLLTFISRDASHATTHDLDTVVRALASQP